MKIFITGASGFVGGAAARHLSRSHDVRAMARSEESAAAVAVLGATPVRCDLQSVTAAHLAGCDAVVHSAAYVEEWGPEEAYRTANVDGTRRLLAAAREARVPRFIFIGTEAVHFHGQDMVNIDESEPYAEHSPYPYSRTKGEAERLVLAASADGFATISLRPRFVWGRGDQSVLPVLLRLIEQGRFSWIGQGRYRTSTTHVTNLVHAIELALTKGQPGNAYFIADQEVSVMREFLTRYLRTQAVEPPKSSIPKWLARSLARAIEGIWSVFRLRGPPPLVRFTADILSVNCTINTAKATRELGYHPVVTIEQGFADMPRLSR